MRACGFDVDAYLADHADLRTAGLDRAGALRHFLVHGYAEQRVVRAAASETALAALLATPGVDPNYVQALSRSLLLGAMGPPDGTGWPSFVPGLVRLAQRAGAVPYVIAGDSHSYAYACRLRLASGAAAPIHLLCAAGSAMGLSNPASKSQYGVRLIDWLRPAAAEMLELGVPVFFKFGQVDAEFVFTFQRLRQEEARFSLAAYEAFVARSVGAYLAFIDQVCSRLDPALLRICAIFPPVLSNAAWARGYVNAHVASLEADHDPEALAAAVRKLEIPDQRTRTDLHALYNAELQAGCARRGLLFVNDFARLIGPEGVVDPAYMDGHTGEDHHLLLTEIQDEIAWQLERFGQVRTASPTSW